MGNEVHVTPTNDAIRHEDSADCPCGPEVIPVEREDGSTGWLYRHHSLDGREACEGLVDAARQALGGMEAARARAQTTEDCICGTSEIGDPDCPRHPQEPMAPEEADRG